MNVNIAQLIKEQNRLESLQDDITAKGDVMSEQDQIQYGKLAVRIRACEKEILAEDRKRFDAANRGGDARYLPMENSKDDRYRSMRAGHVNYLDDDLSSVGAGDYWIDANGKRVNVLSNKQKLSARYESQLPNGLRMSDLSVGRYLRAAYLGDRKGAESEYEVMAAAGSTTSNTGGGYLVPNPLSSLWIDLARAQSTIMAAGAKTIEMTSADLLIARVSGDPTVSIKGENNAWSDSNPTFDAVTLVAKTMGVYSLFSKELWMDAPNIAEIIQSTLTKAVAVELDRQILSGSASQEMTGIDLVDGVNTITSVGSPEWDNLLNAIKLNMLDNHIGTNFAILNPAAWYSLQLLKTGDGTNSAKNYMAPPAPVAALQLLPTTSCPAANAVVGTGEEILVGLRTPISFEISEVANDAFPKYQVAVRAVLRADFALTHSDAFTVLTGIS